ncbi:hypothetical protein TUBRATIS_13050 [Tubulinosema ratisbonensis]|uniref:Uncharacterized protein n=1 Tax=Tubulinosema ratisbonensis TaxID=291195 RepID=A0A437ALZ0_9MICR|nr:hypothetical protein TUBRATIS_13050 [Tubulinosema ratisbonensis]
MHKIEGNKKIFDLLIYQICKYEKGKLKKETLSEQENGFLLSHSKPNIIFISFFGNFLHFKLITSLKEIFSK